MKWHEHLLAHRSMATAMGLTSRDSTEQIAVIRQRLSGYYETLNWQEHSAELVSYNNTLGQLYAEARWLAAKRPFYDVYPSVAEAFMKVDLAKIRLDQINLPLEDLMIRFQVGHELQASPNMLVKSILVSKSEALQDRYAKGTRGLLVSINDGSVLKSAGVGVCFVTHSVIGLVLHQGVTVEEGLARGRVVGVTQLASDPTDQVGVDNVLRLIVALCLLKDNPDLIEPEPIEADRTKWEATHDPKLLEKAARRGLRRWSVGKRITVAPGFRRPHFAIRWMGHGEPKEPVLRPIKGCLVRRQRVTEIPTGYLDKPIDAIVLDDEALCAELRLNFKNLDYLGSRPIYLFRSADYDCS